MALIEKITGKEREVISFLLTGLSGNALYVQTDRFQTEKQLINKASDAGLSLKQTNTDVDREPIAYAPGFFISAQVVKSSVISPNQHKVWEIVE